MDDVINMEMFTSEATPSHVMIGFGVGGFGSCITKQIREMLSLVGVRLSNLD